MRFIDEPAEQVESQLVEQGVTVRREPYNPRNRSLVADFVGFLRTPAAGSNVTLFEDDEGRVRYYSVARADPEVEALRARVEELGRSEGGLIDDDRLRRFEERLARLDVLEAQVARLPALEEKLAAVERLPALEEKVARVAVLEEKVAAVDRLPELEAKVTELGLLDAKVTQLDTLRSRVERLERR